MDPSCSGQVFLSISKQSIKQRLCKLPSPVSCLQNLAREVSAELRSKSSLVPEFAGAGGHGRISERRRHSGAFQNILQSAFHCVREQGEPAQHPHRVSTEIRPFLWHRTLLYLNLGLGRNFSHSKVRTSFCKFPFSPLT